MIATMRQAVVRRVEAVSKKEISPGKRALILIAFCTAQLLDIATTHIGLSEGRQELNGAAAWIIGHDGELAVYGLKLALVSVLVGFLLVFGRRRAGIWNAYLVAAWITTFAVLNNVYRILS
ncbi:MAG: hypothetical protein E6I88_05450 [Chloroflexi bacterium]|nr:MAG: hypothetical protein E6I88_05450 [Chloroflexota bacterium]TME47741.1 MAG: hypothetical protein E6I56_03220 [Chloroflexota bacterium]